MLNVVLVLLTTYSIIVLSSIMIAMMVAPKQNKAGASVILAALSPVLATILLLGGVLWIF